MPERSNNSVPLKLVTEAALVSRPKGLPVTTTSFRLWAGLAGDVWAMAQGAQIASKPAHNGQADRIKTFMISFQLKLQ